MTLVRFQLELFPVLSSTKHQLSLQPGTIREGFPGGTVMKNPPANAGDARDVSSIPGSGRSPGGGDGNPLQYSCLENFMDRGAWPAIIQMVTELDMTEQTERTRTCARTHTHTVREQHGLPQSSQSLEGLDVIRT